MGLEPQSPLAHRVAQTQPFVGGTERIPLLRLGYRECSPWQPQAGCHPQFGETMCIRLMRLLRKCAEQAVPMTVAAFARFITDGDLAKRALAIAALR